MRVFLSWSSPKSQKVALALKSWLPEVIQELQPWVSSEDIDKGQRWAMEVGSRLNECSHGILCVTAENIGNPWLNFEAGAITKSLQESRVSPLLLDLPASAVKGPIAQFQATNSSDRNDMFKLLSSLNDACSKPLELDRLDRSFERNWANLEDELSVIRNSVPADTGIARRSADDMLGEVLERVRELQRSLENDTPFLSNNKEAMTAASYRAAASALRADTFTLRDGTVGHPGSKVRHPQYGIGTIVAKSEGDTVAVRFGGGALMIIPLRRLERLEPQNRLD